MPAHSDNEAVPLESNRNRPKDYGGGLKPGKVWGKWGSQTAQRDYYLRMKRIALVTCQNLPEPDVDEAMTIAAFAHSASVNMAAWDDESVDWASYDAAVIRSTWDYPMAPRAFLQWAKDASESTRLINPYPVIQKNIDKKYLLGYEMLGIPIVPTEPINSTQDLAQAVARFGESIVIKPSIGAGSYLTQFFTSISHEAHKQVEAIQETGSTALVQPFLPSVHHGGERSLIWIGGEFTHKIVKSARFQGDEEVVLKAVAMTRQEQEVAERVVNLVRDDVVYARVDLIEHEGQLLLSELELIEPSLFFAQNPDALEAFVRAVLDQIAD
jgi:hypothetical protein